jgi:hypothetical protein
MSGEKYSFLLTFEETFGILVSNIQTFTVGALLCTVHIMGSNLTWA